MAGKKCVKVWRMLRRSLEIYEEYREPRDLRLRRSSRHENLEREYQKVYNIEEHILYRKQEISSIHQTYQYYKYEKEWLYCLNKKCGIYTEESVYELLGLYLVGESMVERKQDMKKIMECRLNLKDKNLTMGEIYVCHCMNLLDHYSYMLLTNI